LEDEVGSREWEWAAVVVLFWVIAVLARIRLFAWKLIPFLARDLLQEAVGVWWERLVFVEDLKDPPKSEMLKKPSLKS
jgi:hypothetical protein